MLERTTKTYKNNRNGKLFDLVPSVGGGFYWRERDYKGLFPCGATMPFNQMDFDYSLKHGILSCTKG